MSDPCGILRPCPFHRSLHSMHHFPCLVCVVATICEACPTGSGISVYWSFLSFLPWHAFAQFSPGLAVWNGQVSVGRLPLVLGVWNTPGKTVNPNGPNPQLNHRSPYTCPFRVPAVGILCGITAGAVAAAAAKLAHQPHVSGSIIVCILPIGGATSFAETEGAFAGD